MRSVLFSIGSKQGTTECVDIVFANDTLSEELECFSLSLNSGFATNIEAPMTFVPVCIEDDDCM